LRIQEPNQKTFECKLIYSLKYTGLYSFHNQWAWAERGPGLVATSGGGLCRWSGPPPILKVRMQVLFKLRTHVSGVEIKRCWIV